MKRPIALLFCLLMITMPLAGCINNDDNSSDTPDGELSDWNVHFAATVADLPTCNEDTNGRLYYVEADGQFQVCKTAGWEVIAIQGTDGTNGTNGQDGTDGMNGSDGVGRVWGERIVAIQYFGALELISWCLKWVVTREEVWGGQCMSCCLSQVT